MATKATNTVKQVEKFGLIGILNTLIDFIIFMTLTKVFSIPLNSVWMAKLVSGSIAMINSFYFNRTWVFKNQGKDVQGQALRFITSTLVAVFVIQLGLVQLFSSDFPQLGQFGYLVASQLGIISLAPGILTEAFVIKTAAFGLATVASMTWNFLLYKFWAFKN